ncbi:MAG: exonuclease domain-containing protein [bacterium]
MKDLLPRFDFCVFDLETTGLEPDENTGIIEVGSVKLKGGQQEETFQSLADPGHSIPENITEITGLSDQDIQGAPAVDTVLSRFMEFAEGSILIAHNARFDLSFLNYFSSDPVNFDYIDTLRLSRQLINAESHSLSSLSEDLGLTLNRAHRALEDALAAKELFLHLSDKISRPEDYFRCNLPDPILNAASVDVPVTVLPEDSASDPKYGVRDWILLSLHELDTSIGVSKLAKILCGSNSNDIQKYTDVAAYGRLQSRTQSEVKTAIKKAVGEGYVERSGEPYPVLSLTDKGIRHLIGLSDTSC